MLMWCIFDIFSLCLYYYTMIKVIYTTLPKRRKAKQILKTLLREHLVAYGNIAKIDSAYIWNGEITEDREYALILKTTEEKHSKAIERLKELHPYEVPLIMSWKTHVHIEEYFNWMKGILKGD